MKIAGAVVLALLASSGAARAQSLPVPVPALSVDRARAGIVPGTTLTINVGGASGPLNVNVPFAGLDAAYDPVTRRLQLTGHTPGSGTVTLTDRNGNVATIAVLVAPAAGTIPADVDVSLAGSPSAAFVTARIRDAIVHALVQQTGSGLDIHGLTLPPALTPGTNLDVQAGVAIDGRGAYVDVTGRTNVHLRVDPDPPFDPALLFYSDDPEYVANGVAGVLFRGTIDAQTPARLFAYHVDAGAPRATSLILRSPVASRVRILGTISGASSAFAYIGQQSSSRFLAARATGESTVVALSAGVPYEIPFGIAQNGDLLEAIEDLRVLSGGPVTVLVTTRPAGAALPPLDDPQLPGDSHGRRGIFALTNLPALDLHFTSAGAEPQPLSVGDAALPNQTPDGRPLGGDYGVVRRVALHLTNASAAPLQVYLYELTSGSGGATTTMWFDGDAAATQIPCVDDAMQPHLIKTFTLAAGETRTTGAAFMTDGASSYPIRFGLTRTPPLSAQPGACIAAPPP